MTVSSTTDRNDYVGDGSTTEFVFRNKIFVGTDLAVFLDGVRQTITTDYTVTIDTEDNEATVTFVAAPASSVAVALLQEVPNTQGSSYPAGGSFPSAVTEAGLDRRTIVAQGLQGQITRAIGYLKSDANLPSATLPTLEALKGKVLGFSATTGAPVVLDPDTLGGGVSDSTLAGNWGSTYDLSYGAGTDQAAALQTVLDAAAVTAATYGPQTVRPVTTGGALRLDARVLVPSNVTLDLSQTPVTFGKYGEVAIQGALEESPSSDLIRLASDAAAGASTIYLNSVNASNATLLGSNGTVSYVIIRGKSDANTRAIQRHEGLLTIVDNADTANIECTIDPPLPDDEGTWEVEYDAGDYEEATGTVDRTLITVVTSAALASNVAENAQVITLSDATDFQAGTLAVLYDDRLASSVDGVSTNSIRTEIIKVRRQPSANELVYPEVPISKDFLTANSARLLKITPVENAHITGLRCFGIAEGPDDPGSRIHYAKGTYCIGCTINDVQIDDSTATYEHRGQAARFERAYDCHIIGGFRKFSPIRESASGDEYGAALYYCNQSTIVGFQSWFCRHGVLNQGSVNGAFVGCRAISPQINGWDLHGLDERNWLVLDCVSEGPEWGAEGSSQRSGGTIGNSFHAGGAKNVTVSGGAIRGFQAGDNSSGVGIVIRPNVTKVQILDSVRFTACDRGVQANADEEWPTLGFGDIDIQCNMDGCYIGVGVDATMPAWDVATTYTGTATRPVHVENSGNVYATSTTTLGGSAPTHGSGTVGDWAYVSAAQRPAYDFHISGYIRNATRPCVFVRVDDLDVVGLKVQAAQGIEITDCPNSLWQHPVAQIAGDGDWLIDGGDNDSIRIENKLVGSSEIDNSGGSTIEDYRLKPLAEAVADLGSLAFADNIGAAELTVSGSKLEDYVIAYDDEGNLKSVAQAGGISAVTHAVVTVPTSTELTAALHAEGPSGGNLVKRLVVARHASSQSTAVALTLEEDCTLPVRVRQANDQTGTVTITRSGTNTFNGSATSIVLGGPGATVTIEPGRVSGDFAVEGEFVGLGTIVGGISSPILDSADASTPHTLTMAEHAGRTVLMTGNTTVPATDGFSATLIASGANRDVDAGGAALTVDSGDAVTVFSDGTTVWNTPAITLATLATS